MGNCDVALPRWNTVHLGPRSVCVGGGFLLAGQLQCDPVERVTSLWSGSVLCLVLEKAGSLLGMTHPCCPGPPSRCNLEGQPLLLGTLFLTLLIKSSITLCWLGGSLFAKQLRYMSPRWLVGGGSCNISCPVNGSGQGRALSVGVVGGTSFCGHHPAWCRMEWSGGHAVIA